MFSKQAVRLGIIFAAAHIGLCIASLLAWERMYPVLGIVDLPLTIVAGGLAWRFGLPLLPFHLVLGTAFWFFVPVFIHWVRAELEQARKNLASR
jgi:hypothetical protein